MEYSANNHDTQQKTATQNVSSESEQTKETDSGAGIPRFLTPGLPVDTQTNDEQQANRVSTDVMHNVKNNTLRSRPTWTGKNFPQLPLFLRGMSGQSLPDGVRREFEQHTRQSVGDVSIHTNQSADRANRQLRARAFTCCVSKTAGQIRGVN